MERAVGYIKVEGESALVRDEASQAILNLDTRQLREYKLARSARQSERERIAKLESTVEDMDTKLDSILSLLRGRE